MMSSMRCASVCSSLAVFTSNRERSKGVRTAEESQRISTYSVDQFDCAARECSSQRTNFTSQLTSVGQ